MQQPGEEPGEVLGLRLLVCQTDGALGASVEENVSRWRARLLGESSNGGELGRGENKNLDVVHFPETAFMPYFYSSAEAFEKYGAAEERGKGPVFAFARELALATGAYVIVGYAERGSGGDLHNSLYVVGRDGALVANHRKRDFFTPDYVWATPPVEAGQGGAPKYTTLALQTRQGEEFLAGLVVCQELLGPAEQLGLGRECAVTRQFAAQGVQVMFFSNIWPNWRPEQHRFPGQWDEQLAPMVLRPAGHEFLLCVAAGCGSESNCLSAEQWGPARPRFHALGTLLKRGCSGVKKWKSGLLGPEDSCELLVGMGEYVDTVLPVQEEGWRIYEAKIKR